MSDGTTYTVHDRVLNDTLTPIYVALKQSDVAVDLTGMTLASVFVAVDTKTATAGTATATDAANGLVTIPVPAAVTATAGDYAVYVTTTLATKVDHYPADGERLILRVHAR